jgi:predicted ribosomally synthesized peptide with nif11-like leader
MSMTDAERFAAALAQDEKLRESVKPLVSGLASFVEAAKKNGYDFTIEEAKQLIRSKAGPSQLSTEELGAVAGGGTAVTNTVAAGVTATTGAGVSEVVGAIVLI